MSYLARLKAADLTDAPTRTTAKTATNSSGSYGGSQEGAISENECAQQVPNTGQRAFVEVVRLPAGLESANSANTATQSTATTAKSPYDSFSSAQGMALREDADREWAANLTSDEGAPTRCWQVQYPSLAAMELLFCPEASRAEVEALYPGAEIERLTEPRCKAASPAEATQLSKLVALVLPDADADERAEVLAVALADPQAALISLQALSVDLHPDPPFDPDDRRTCPQCRNLTLDGRCRAAARGDLPDVASRPYSPVPDLPRRCGGHLPGPADPDRRTGHERWPRLRAQPHRGVAR